METFKKRQKEMKRLEKQRDKAARRIQRKQDKALGIEEPSVEGEVPEGPDAATGGESPETEPAEPSAEV